MSQHWHGHWTNEAFKPVRLRNWEVPNWHPCWPDRHCKVTQFMADNRGRILVGQKKSTQSPWGNFKGTWELPLKLNRQKAYELSLPPQHKIDAWEQHKKVNKQVCAASNRKELSNGTKIDSSTPNLASNAADTEFPEEADPGPPSPQPRIADTIPRTPCPIHNACEI